MSQMIMYEEEYRQVSFLLNRLYREANTRACYIIDKNGQLVAQAGETQGMDSTSLSSLIAGSIAATGSLAKLMGEKEFLSVFHEGVKDHMHVSVVGQRVILVVLFDQRSSLGLIRLRVRKITDELDKIFVALAAKVASPTKQTPFSEITDEDIDSLFQDDEIEGIFKE
jgi:predicted regulator of Ras-like GTPase activity (Roadblock/LC7/MglB family)